MGIYQINYIRNIHMFILVEADSEEDALAMYKDCEINAGDGEVDTYTWNYEADSALLIEEDD